MSRRSSGREMRGRGYRRIRPAAFPDAALDTWSIEAQRPDEFLVHLYRFNPDLMVNILHEQSAFIGRHSARLLAVLKQGVPDFAQLISDSERAQLQVQQRATEMAFGAASMSAIILGVG